MTPRRLLLAVCFALVCQSALGAWQWQLGQQYMSFETTATTPAAKQLFINGLGFFHNFLFPQAGASFKAAQVEDPSFVMAYWGEAVSYKHGIWNEENSTAANEVLDRLDAQGPQVLANVTDRERSWIAAIRKQYERGLPEHTRDVNYRDAMRELAASYPQYDDELCFAALAELTVLQPQDGGYNLRAASTYPLINATLQKVLARNSMHPCANHYLIHSSDTPEWAPGALVAGQRYAMSSPSAWHASHMITHLFKHLGRWGAVGIYNRRAVSISRQYGIWSNGNIGTEDWHSARFLHYCAIQQGKPQTAINYLNEITGMGESSGGAVRRMMSVYWMSSLQFVEMKDWTNPWLVNFPPLIDCPDCHERENLVNSMQSSSQGNIAMLFAVGYAAVHRGNLTAAEMAVEKLHAIETETRGLFNNGTSTSAWIGKQVIHAAIQYYHGNKTLAFDIMHTVIPVELALGSPSFEPPLFPPAYETLAGWEIETHHYHQAYATLNDATLLPCAGGVETLLPCNVIDSASTYHQRDYNRGSAVFLRARAAEMSGQIALALPLYELLMSQYGDAEDHPADTPDFLSSVIHERITLTKAFLAANSNSNPNASTYKTGFIISLVANGVLLILTIGLCCRSRKPSASAKDSHYDTIHNT